MWVSREFAWDLQSRRWFVKLAVKMMIKLLVLTIMATTAWATLFPEEALALLAEVKRWLRARVIRQSGKIGAKELSLRLQDWGDQNRIEPQIIDELLAEHQDEVIQHLGQCYADQTLGEADLTERYF